MSYDAYETSTESGSPVEVYEVVAGAQTYYLTSAQADQVLGAVTYETVKGLQRERSENGPDRRERDFTVELPTEHEVAQLFLGTLPGYRVRLTVKRFHADDLPTPEVVQVFDGYVIGAGFSKGEGKICTLTARPLLATVGRLVPRRTYQSSCNHVLYDPTTCQVDDTDSTFRAASVSVASQVGTTLTISGGLSGVYVDGWFEAGFVEIVGGTDFRLILTHVGDVLGLLSPFASSPSVVNVYAGCAHTIQVCGDKFDNVLRFGGFAFVPTKNPFATGVL